MKLPFGWALPALAVGATIVALAAGPNRSLAVPAAAVAVAAAGLALWLAARRWGHRETVSANEMAVVDSTADWFDEGVMGQEAIVLMLDRIERQLTHPELPSRSTEEFDRIRMLPPEEFLDYVEHRLNELESGA